MNARQIHIHATLPILLQEYLQTELNKKVLPSIGLPRLAHLCWRRGAPVGKIREENAQGKTNLPRLCTKMRSGDLPVLGEERKPGR
jgi:hypothetical protein